MQVSQVVSIVRDVTIADTFLHVSPNSLLSGIQVVRVKAIGSSTESTDWKYLWIQVDEFLQHPSRAVSSWLLPERYLVEALPHTILEGHRVREMTVRTFNNQGYQILQDAAETLTSHLFLEQVRVVQKGQIITLVIPIVTGKIQALERVEGKVESIDPNQSDDGWGILATNSQLVILDAQSAIEEPINSIMDSIRVRKASSSMPAVHPDTMCQLGLPENWIVTDEELSPGWLYLPASVMKTNSLLQHQWISMAKVKKLKLGNENQSENPTIKQLPYIRPIEFKQVTRLRETIQLLYNHSLRTARDHKRHFSLGSKSNGDEIPRLEVTWALVVKGEPQVGKSWMARYLVDHANFPSYYINFANDNPEKVFQDHLGSILLVAPAVLFIDHLPLSLLPSISEEGMSVEVRLRRDELQFWWQRQLHFLLDNLHCPVVMFVTLEADMERGSSQPLSLAKLDDNPLLLKCLDIGRPEIDQRALLLGTNDTMLLEQTVGLLPHQLLAYGANPNNTRLLSIVNLQRSLESNNKMPSWFDLAGMREAKQQLMEELIWPLQYTELYARHNVRQPAGLLITGETGSGKTFLLRTLTQYLTGVSSSKKGPLLGLESIFRVDAPALLNKYMGGTEAAIRRLFDQARSHAPSLIIIEELDVLAGRRGSDPSSGMVTDRIVNQLLTELDGPGGRMGVHVLATTSRPTLLDPAVVRAGRLSGRVQLPGRSMDGDDRLSLIEYCLCQYGASTRLKEWLVEELKGWTPAEIAAVIAESATEIDKASIIDEVASENDFKSINNVSLILPIVERHRKRIQDTMQPRDQPIAPLTYAT